jgi:TRAP-type C4-dicarboxylate transport system substrate-binding protein
VKALGASPTTIAWAEVYTSLQTGVVDGQMNPISIIAMAKFQEVQKYITLTNHLYAPYVWVINPKFYNSLSSELKAVVDDAARTAIVAGRGLSRIIDSTDKGLPTLAEKMQVYVPSKAEMKQFRDATIPAAREFMVREYKDDGKFWVDKFFDAIDKAERNLDTERTARYRPRREVPAAPAVLSERKALPATRGWRSFLWKIRF